MRQLWSVWRQLGTLSDASAETFPSSATAGQTQQQLHNCWWCLEVTPLWCSESHLSWKPMAGYCQRWTPLKRCVVCACTCVCNSGNDSWHDACSSHVIRDLPKVACTGRQPWRCLACHKPPRGFMLPCAKPLMTPLLKSYMFVCRGNCDTSNGYMALNHSDRIRQLRSCCPWQLMLCRGPGQPASSGRCVTGLVQDHPVG